MRRRHGGQQQEQHRPPPEPPKSTTWPCTMIRRVRDEGAPIPSVTTGDYGAIFSDVFDTYDVLHTCKAASGHDDGDHDWLLIWDHGPIPEDQWLPQLQPR
jgi:hypothetical protein